MATDMMPEEVPILSARHMHKGNYNHPTKKDCHCLAGWLRVVFVEMTHPSVDFPFLIAQRSIVDARAEAGFPNTPIVDLNDLCGLTKSELARIWNRAMYLIDYTEGNPESKPLPNMRRKP